MDNISGTEIKTLIRHYQTEWVLECLLICPSKLHNILAIFIYGKPRNYIHSTKTRMTTFLGSEAL